MKRHSKLRTQLAAASVGMSLLLVAQASKAASIGQTHIHSQQHEPLLASIDIHDIDSADFAVAIASESTYQQMGLNNTAPIRVEFVKKSSNSGALILTSNTPISEPFADVVLIVNNQGRTQSVPTTLLLPLEKQAPHLNTTSAIHLNEQALPLSDINKQADTDKQRQAQQQASMLTHHVQVRSPLPSSYNNNAPTLEPNDDFEPLLLSNHLVPPLLESNTADASLALSAPTDNTLNINNNRNNRYLAQRVESDSDNLFVDKADDYQPLQVFAKTPPQLFSESVKELSNVDHTQSQLVVLNPVSNDNQPSKHTKHGSFKPLIVSQQIPPPIVTTIPAHNTFEPLEIISATAPVIYNNVDSGSMDTKRLAQMDTNATVLIVKRTITHLPPNIIDFSTDLESTDNHVSVVNVKVMRHLKQMAKPKSDQVLVPNNRNVIYSNRI